MPVEVRVDSPFHEIADQAAATHTFHLHSPAEITKIAAEAAAVGQQVLVFAHWLTSVRLIAARLTLYNLRVAVLTGDLDYPAREQLLADVNAGRYDVIVTSDAFATGWRAPATCTRVLHMELPPVNGGFTATMLQREMRVRVQSDTDA